MIVSGEGDGCCQTRTRVNGKRKCALECGQCDSYSDLLRDSYFACQTRAPHKKLTVLRYMIKNASWGHTLCTYRNGQIFKILSLEPSCVRTTPLVLLVCPSIICKVFCQCIAAPPVSHYIDVTLETISLSLSPSHRLTQSRPPFLAPHFLSLYPTCSFSHSLTLSAPLTLLPSLSEDFAVQHNLWTLVGLAFCVLIRLQPIQRQGRRVWEQLIMGIGVLCFGDLWRCEMMWGTLRNRRLGSLRICQSPPDHVIVPSLPGAAPR